MKERIALLEEVAQKFDAPRQDLIFNWYTSPMWYVYVLLCSDSSLYTGITKDPEKRLEDHKLRKGGAYTRAHKAIRIVYQVESPTRSQALKREAEIKSWSRREKISKLQLEQILN